LFDLVLAQYLPVNQYRTIVHIRVFLFCKADCIDEAIRGRITIGVDKNLPAVGVSLLDGLVGGLLVDGGIAPVILGLSLGRDMVGFGQPGWLALR
jgi:hypothetical protein